MRPDNISFTEQVPLQTQSLVAPQTLCTLRVQITLEGFLLDRVPSLPRTLTLGRRWFFSTYNKCEPIFYAGNIFEFAAHSR